MTDLEALLAAVIAKPDEDTPRLLYADELEANGQSERAEFIRVQVAIAAMEEDGDVGPPADGHTCCEDPCPVCGVTKRYQSLVARQRELLATQVPHPAGGHSSLELVMRGPVRLVKMPGLVDYEFRRGFVESVTCTAADWFAHGDAIRKAHPVTRVTLATWPTLSDLIVTGNHFRFRFEEGPGWRRIDSPGGAVVDENGVAEMLAVEWPGVTFELPPLPRMTLDGVEVVPGDVVLFYQE